MVAEEHYVFKPETRRKLVILLIVGVVLTIGGLYLAIHPMHGYGKEAEAVTALSQQVASLDHTAAISAAEPEGTPVWLKRVYASLWMNNVFFVGIGLIGLFFVAVQYAASAGWSAGILRVPISMGTWLPIGGVLTLILWFIAKGDLFHWTHAGLYQSGGSEYDDLLDRKAGYFFWPAPAGSFPVFYIFRMLLFFSMWYVFLIWIRREMLAEDLDGETKHWFKARRISAWFLVFFAISSSVSAWDWLMSIDPHWFSTMFGWYTFASWWVTGLSVITLIVITLKESGYLKIVNSNHLHDLGKFIFAFSIFWTYTWFGQFLLIYYANMPEETIYFIERMKTYPYAWIFYLILFTNFVLPFLLLMTRDAKRHFSPLRVVCFIVIAGHWFDFYNMVTPGVVKGGGAVGFLEIGITLIFVVAFLWVFLTSLSRIPLIGRNHPMMEESLHHHI